MEDPTLLDDDIVRHLKKFKVNYQIKQGEGDIYLCLACAFREMWDYPIVAQGQSLNSESEAKMEASLNLIHSLQVLGHSCE